MTNITQYLPAELIDSQFAKSSRGYIYPKTVSGITETKDIICKFRLKELKPAGFKHYFGDDDNTGKLIYYFGK